MERYEFVLSREEAHDLIDVLDVWLVIYNKEKYSKRTTNIRNIFKVLSKAVYGWSYIS
jgi:hypothetical protein